MSISNNDQSSSNQTPRVKTFKKGFLKQFGILFILIPFFFLLVWLGLNSAEARTASFVTAGVTLLLSLAPFLQVGSVKVEPNKITIETFFEEKVFTASQIKEIKMSTVRGRYGRVTNFVNILPVEGKNYPVGKFIENEKVIYDFLMNWWNTYKNN